MSSQIIIITIIIAIIIAFIFIIMIIMIMIMIMIISIITDHCVFLFFLSCSQPIKYQMRGSRKQTTVSLGGDG